MIICSNSTEQQVYLCLAFLQKSHGNSIKSDIKWFESHYGIYRPAKTSIWPMHQPLMLQNVTSSTMWLAVKWPDMKWLIEKSSNSKQSQRTLELILKVRGLVRDLTVRICLFVFYRVVYKF
jgi:hypothetical protein